MGKKTDTKLIVLIILFGLSSFFAYGYAPSPPSGTKPPISDYMGNFSGFKLETASTLSDEHVAMLDLDDYFFGTFTGNGTTANLYIGYYYSADKAYSAHSPLVCYPSQGWKIDTKPLTGRFDTGPYTINYEEAIASFGQKRELIIYWYQSHLVTNTQVYRNKIAMAYNKLVNDDEQHAFVRVSVPFPEGAAYTEVKNYAVDFIKVFYPTFISFIQEGDLPERQS